MKMHGVYTIIINEAQCIGLVELLEQYKMVHGFEPLALEYWLGMLKDLPREEREHPGIHHGFCL